MKLIILGILLFTTLGHTNDIRANVIAVKTTDVSGKYRFAVTLKSDETGCEQYTDWWEVLSKNGELLYRRILVHSHPDTQPFTRSGGNVEIRSDDIVYVRAHMNKLGYIGDVFIGSADTGFKKAVKIPSFSKVLDKQSPLPNGCAF